MLRNWCRLRDARTLGPRGEIRKNSTAGTSPAVTIRRIHANMETRTNEGESVERNDEPRLAVLIDADNTAAKWADAI